MDKMNIAVGVGVITGIYLASRLIKNQKHNRPTLETINDYHLYQSQQEQIKNGSLLANNNTNSNQPNFGNVNPNSFGAQNVSYPNGGVNGFYNQHAYSIDMKNPNTSANQENYVSPYAHLINNEPNKK